MKSLVSISFVFCATVAVALLAVGSAAASVGVNCVKPFDLTSKSQDLTNCKMNGVTTVSYTHLTLPTIYSV